MSTEENTSRLIYRHVAGLEKKIALLESQKSALVDALTRLRKEWKYQCDIGNVPDGRIEIDIADAAIRNAGDM